MNLVSLIIVFASLFVIGRYMQIMLFDYPDLENRYEELTSRDWVIKKDRGKIIDSKNNILAESIYKYDFWVNTTENHNKAKIINLFSDVFDTNKETYTEKLNKKSKYCALEKHVGIDKAETILNAISVFMFLRSV